MKRVLLSGVITTVAFSLLSLAPSTVFAQVYPSWAFQPGGFGFTGQNGIVLANVDGTGLPEVVVTGMSSAEGGGSNGLAIVEYRDGAYLTSSVTPSCFGSSGRILRVDTTGPQDSVVLACGAGSFIRLQTWTGKPLEKVSDVPAPAEFNLSQVADMDADGRLEILGFVRSFSAPVPGTGPAFLMDFETGIEEWRSSQDVANVAAGQLDADPALEIVLGRNTMPGMILDGATRAEQWNYPDGFAGKTVFGNFWGTTEPTEFAQLAAANKIFVSQPFFSPVFEFIASSEVFAVEDINADQYDDFILYGSFEKLRAYSSRTGVAFFEWLNPGFDPIAAIAAGNTDGIGGKELVIGARDTLHIISAETGENRYLSKKTYGPYSSLQVADVQGDGRREVVFSVARGDGGQEQIVVVDADTGVEIRRRVSLPFAMGNTPPLVESLDMEGDGKDEIVIGVAQSVALMDGTTLGVRWSAPIQDAGVVRRLKLMKFNADTVDDIVVGASQRVLILDGRNGSELFRSAVLINISVFDIAIGNMDTDLQSEIAIGRDQLVYVVDPYSGQSRILHSSAQNAIGLEIENTGTCALVLVKTSSLERRSCADGALLSTRMFPHGAASFVAFPQTSHDDLITADQNMLYRVRGDSIVARSTLLGTGVGSFNLGVINTNGTSITAYVGGYQGINRVDLPFELLFRDGFDQR